MNCLTKAATEICRFMSDNSWEFCIIGGLALQRWGEPRTTMDVDITLVTGWGEEAPYVDALLDGFDSRMPDARTFALENRILLLRSTNGKDIDVALGALPFEHEMVRRAVPVEFAPGTMFPCCSAEDLFVMKAFAGRPRDWIDAESIVARQTTLDTSYIIEQLSALASAVDNVAFLQQAQEILKSAP